MKGRINVKMIDKVGKAIITQWIDDSEFGWPPDCTGFLYQPERPEVKTVSNGIGNEERTQVNETKEK